MNNFKVLFPVGVVLQVFIIQVCTAQVYRDSTFTEKALANAISYYQKSVGEQASLYNGRKYEEYQYPIKQGHPYFGPGDVTRGNIYYDGMLYEDIPLWYDLVQNEIIVQSSYSKIVLNNYLISDFSIFNHHFIRLTQDSAADYSIPSGFYDQLYHGKTALLAKRSKRAEQSISDMSIGIKISEPANQYYIQKDGKYYSLKNAGSMLRVLGDKRQELQQYIKSNNIRLKRGQEEEMVEVMAYYDTLTN